MKRPVPRYLPKGVRRGQHLLWIPPDSLPLEPERRSKSRRLRLRKRVIRRRQPQMPTAQKPSQRESSERSFPPSRAATTQQRREYGGTSLTRLPMGVGGLPLLGSDWGLHQPLLAIAVNVRRL